MAAAAHSGGAQRRLGDRGDNAGAGGAASSRGSSLVCLAQMPKNGEESPRFPVLCYWRKLCKYFDHYVEPFYLYHGQGLRWGGCNGCTHCFWKIILDPEFFRKFIKKLKICTNGFEGKVTICTHSLKFLTMPLMEMNYSLLKTSPALEHIIWH